MCFGGGSTKIVLPSQPAPPPPPPAPGPSAEELELRRIQNQLLQRNLAILDEQQRAEERRRGILESTLGMPIDEIIARQASQEIGFLESTQAAQRRALEQTEAERQAFIAATGMTPEQAAAEEGQRQLVLGRELGGRFEKALRGELPVSPGLERSLQEQERELREVLRRDLGPGYETSTPGSIALEEFRKRANELRESARTGAITEAEQVGFALVPATQRLLQSRQGFLSGNVASPLPVTAPFAQRMIFENPPQLGPLAGQLMSDRELLSRHGLAAFQGALAARGQDIGVQDAILRAQLGAAGARAQAGGQLLSSLLQAGGQIGAAALCWIAEAIYGADSEEFIFARFWIANAWDGAIARIVRRLYMRFGKTIAKCVRKHLWARFALKIIFDVAVSRGREALEKEWGYR